MGYYVYRNRNGWRQRAWVTITPYGPRPGPYTNWKRLTSGNQNVGLPPGGWPNTGTGANRGPTGSQPPPGGRPTGSQPPPGGWPNTGTGAKQVVGWDYNENRTQKRYKYSDGTFGKWVKNKERTGWDYSDDNRQRRYKYNDGTFGTWSNNPQWSPHGTPTGGTGGEESPQSIFDTGGTGPQSISDTIGTSFLHDNPYGGNPGQPPHSLGWDYGGLDPAQAIRRRARYSDGSFGKWVSNPLYRGVSQPPPGGGHDDDDDEGDTPTPSSGSGSEAFWGEPELSVGQTACYSVRYLRLPDGTVKAAPGVPPRRLADGLCSDVPNKNGGTGVIGGGGGGPPEETPTTETPTTEEETPTDDDDDESIVGSGILDGGTLIHVLSTNGQDILYTGIAYEWQGQKFLFRFDDAQQIEQFLGSDWEKEWKRDTRRIGEGQVRLHWTNNDGGQDAPYYYAGPVGEVTGLSGSGNFETFANNLLRDAFQSSSFNDPTIQGRIHRDPEIQKLLVLRSLLDWSPQHFEGEVRKTAIYREVYPGIETFFGKTSDPENAWRQYYATVVEQIRGLGYQPDEYGSYREIVGDLLQGRVSAQEWNAFSATFRQAQENANFADSLNVWLRREGQPEIDFEGWIDILSGTSDLELGNIVERANLQFESTRQGVPLSLNQIDTLASDTSLSQQDQRQVINVISQQLGSLGVEGMRQAGLSLDHLLAGNTGRSYQGFSPEEIRRRVTKGIHDISEADEFEFRTEFRRQRSS